MILAIPSSLGKGNPSFSMLALIRHGSYTLSTGHLDDLGRQQASQIGQIIAQYSPWDEIRSSPSIRTQETAFALQAWIRGQVFLDETLSPDAHPRESYLPFSCVEKLILVTHAPILHSLMRTWARFLSVPELPLLSVGEGYLILPDQRTIKYIRANQQQ